MTHNPLANPANWEWSWVEGAEQCRWTYTGPETGTPWLLVPPDPDVAAMDAVVERARLSPVEFLHSVEGRMDDVGNLARDASYIIDACKSLCKAEQVLSKYRR